MREKFIAKVGEVTVEFNLLHLRNGKNFENLIIITTEDLVWLFKMLNVTAVLRIFFERE